MAHPMVEKLKEAGLRYGDKAAVALTSLLFVVLSGGRSVQDSPSS